MTTSTTESKLIHGFKNFLIFAGVFNILATILFVLPATANWYVKLLSDLNQNLHLGGAPIPLITDPFTMNLVNCLGVAIVLIGSNAIYCSFDPSKHQVIPLLNGVARIVFCFISLWSAFFNNLPMVMLGFGMMDGFIGSFLVYYVVRVSQEAKQASTLSSSGIHTTPPKLRTHSI